jgi:hypothetical protein
LNYTTFRSFHFISAVNPELSTFSSTYQTRSQSNKWESRDLHLVRKQIYDQYPSFFFFVEKMCEERWSQRLEGCDLVREGSSFFWDVRQGRLVVTYRHFGVTYRDQIQWLIGLAAWALKSGPIECPETALTNYWSNCVTSQKSGNFFYTAAEAYFAHVVRRFLFLSTCSWLVYQPFHVTFHLVGYTRILKYTYDARTHKR